MLIDFCARMLMLMDGRVKGMSSEYVVAIHPYKVESSQYELSIASGDRIRVVLKDPSGWWQGELRGSIGLFPSNYTIVAPPPSPAFQKKVLPPALAVEATPLMDQSYSIGGPTPEERTSIVEKIKAATSLEEVENLEKKLKAYYPSKQSTFNTWPPTEAEALSFSSSSPPSDTLDSSSSIPSFPTLSPSSAASSAYTSYPPHFSANSNINNNNNGYSHPHFASSPQQQQFSPSYPSPAYQSPSYSSPTYPSPSYSSYYGYDHTAAASTSPSASPSYPSPSSHYFPSVSNYAPTYQHDMSQPSYNAFYGRPMSFLPSHPSMRPSLPPSVPHNPTQPVSSDAWETSVISSANGVLECRHWLRGFCRMGTGCRFSHAGVKGSATIGTTPSPLHAATQTCRHHLKGFCHLGANCSFVHVDPSESAPAAPGTEESLAQTASSSEMQD